MNREKILAEIKLRLEKCHKLIDRATARHEKEMERRAEEDQKKAA